jgi:hypothetical protein
MTSTTSTADVQSLAATYPSLEAAQGFVIPSYQWMVVRIEAADSRIQTLMTFVATVTLAVPATRSALGGAVAFQSIWFVAAMVAAVAVVLVGVVARTRGAIVLPDPTALYNESAGLSVVEFQRDALYFAGKHFAKNKATVESKQGAVSAMTWLFLAELSLLLTWVIRG